jgi:hypothetical protein
MSDREFAIVIRRMLLAIVAKIEQRYCLGKHADATIQEIHEEDSVVIP